MTRRFITPATIAASVLLATLGSAGAQTSATQDSTSSSVSTDQSGVSASGSVQGSVTTDSPSASPSLSTDQESSKARGLDPDKKTGLDRADEAAGTHGQQGRDNAREKQER